MISPILSALVLLAALSSNVTYADGSSACAKVTLAGGDTCSTLTARWSLNDCNDHQVSEGKIKCRDEDHADLKIQGEKAVYRVSAARSGGAWGDWVLSGNPQSKKLASSSKEAPEPAKAQPQPDADRSPASTAPKPGEDVKPAAGAAPVTGFSFYGFFDANYMHNFNGSAVTPPASVGTQAVPATQLRFYDVKEGALNLSLAELTFKYTGKETSFFADLDFGNTADINATSGTFVDEVTKHIGQAVLSYNPAFAPRLSFDLGKMASHVGLESIKSKDDWNYSRSLLFIYAGPLWHTGLRAGYMVVPDKLLANVYIYNAWAGSDRVNSTPTLGAQLKWTPNSDATVIYNYLGGPNQIQNNSNWRQVHDLNATYSLTQKLSVAFDATLGTEQFGGSSVGWQAIETLGKYQFNSLYSLAARIEFDHDPNGYIFSSGSAETISSYTLTNSFSVVDGLELRAEGKIDHSTSGTRFLTPGGTSANQGTFTLGILYKMQ